MKKGIKIFIIFILVVVLIGVAVITITSLTSKKLVCTSNEGSITIMYNDKTITGYTANGITYDLDGQKTVANKLGIDAYLTNFKTWFSTNTTGTCK